jgi:hypothetical protein
MLITFGELTGSVQFIGGFSFNNLLITMVNSL